MKIPVSQQAVLFVLKVLHFLILAAALFLLIRNIKLVMKITQPLPPHDIEIIIKLNRREKRFYSENNELTKKRIQKLCREQNS